MVYCKSKNAKKYRRGVEYGSARWGGPKDIAPYIDPVGRLAIISFFISGFIVTAPFP